MGHTGPSTIGLNKASAKINRSKYKSIYLFCSSHFVLTKLCSKYLESIVLDFASKKRETLLIFVHPEYRLKTKSIYAAEKTT